MKQHLWDLEAEEFVACIKMLFPVEIEVDSGTKLHISKISPIYTLEAQSNVQETAENGLMVTSRRIELRLLG